MSWKSLLCKLYIVTLISQVCSRENVETIYDFIVVGGGTSGCAVAGRLSENGRYTVLLLERGQEPPESVLVPALIEPSMKNSNIARTYHTVPQRNAGLKENGVLSFITANALGGDSSINAMWFNRGSPYSYDNWARITGDESWSYSNLLRLFKKMETYQGLFPSDQHGYHGPITVSRPRYAPAINDTLEAGGFLGFPISDANGPQKISFAPVEYSQRFGRRVSSYEAYIRPFLGQRPNLNILENAEVSKILIEGNRATGVIYNSPSGQSITLHARKEVVVSAGVLNSPVILQKSGIGPKDVLKQARIPIVKDLPVGKNAHDHVIVMHRFILKNTTEVFTAKRDLTLENFHFYKYFGDGPFTSYSSANVQAFYASSKVPRSLQWGDLQLVFTHTTDPLTLPGFPDLAPNDLSEGEVAITAFLFLVRPRSRGTVYLNTTNPEADPLIDFQYLEDSQDNEVTLEGLKLLVKVFEGTPQYQRHGARLPQTPLPACAHLPFRSDKYWRCYIRQMSVAGLHGAGTVRMGHGPNDKDAVVDSRLRVIGVDNLRVADCSVMPEVVNANTQVAAYVIAEKVSEDILQTWEVQAPRSYPPHFNSRHAQH